jgi:hypothetical protein
MGIAGCLVAVAAVLSTFVISNRLTAKRRPAVDVPAAQVEPKKPVRAWNMALGDVVVVAPEIGFAVKDLKAGTELDPTKFVARVDSRLKTVRELYRQESQKNGALMGGMVLQLNIAATGEVTQVKEVASRIIDGEFRKAVLAEAASWSFEDLVSESVLVHCPLLFIREGMDITTVIQWERSLGLVENILAVTPTKNPNPIPPSKVGPAPKAAQTAVKPVTVRAEDNRAASLAGQTEALHQMKYASSLRKQPNFAAPPIARLTVGTRVAVVNSRGDWLEIRTGDDRYAGFIRKEFVAPAESLRKP